MKCIWFHANLHFQSEGLMIKQPNAVLVWMSSVWNKQTIEQQKDLQLNVKHWRQKSMQWG